jgi:hypothetical protein
VARVFISYRRDDTSAHAGRLADALIARFGRDGVFMDIDAISPGVDFEQRIHAALAECDVVLVLIGDEWLDVRSPDGGRRLDDEEDFVRREIVGALGRTDLTVVPVLVEGAEMPPPKDLPSDVAPLARRHAFELSDTRWRYDVGRLADLIDEAAGGSSVARFLRRLPRAGVALAGLAAAAVAIAIVLVAGGGGGGASADPAAKVAACQERHGLSRPSERRAAHAGESQIDPPEAPLIQSAFVSCTWPPGPGADPDGYGLIAVTQSEGPGDNEATGRDYADRVESECDRLRVEYSYAKMGDFERLPALIGAPGQIWAPGAQSFGRVASSGLLNLPFTPLRRELTILRNLSYRLDGVRCIA